jgi:hypothetical protein
MKETAIQWLLEELNNGRHLNDELIEKAKEMEKNQIIDAHGNKQKKSGGVTNYTYILTGEEYYKEEYER